jgi:hypothetical protein
MRFLLVALLAVFVIPLANAQNNTSDALAAATAAAQCKIDFAVSVINASVALSPSANLSSTAAMLEDDRARLRLAANNNSPQQLRDFVRARLDPDLRQVRDDALRAVRGVGGSRSDLNAAYQALRREYQDCHTGAVGRFSSARTQALEAQLDTFQRRSDQLQAQGIDTANLTQLISDARSRIVMPLQAAVSNATDGQALSGAIHSYCLFDGCNGTNYHLDARFEVARLRAISGYVGAQWNLSAADLAPAAGSLDAAQQALDQAGDAAFNATQRRDVWENIQAAAQELKRLRQGGGG